MKNELGRTRKIICFKLIFIGSLICLGVIFGFICQTAIKDKSEMIAYAIQPFHTGWFIALSENKKQVETLPQKNWLFKNETMLIENTLPKITEVNPILIIEAICQEIEVRIEGVPAYECAVNVNEKTCQQPQVHFVKLSKQDSEKHITIKIVPCDSYPAASIGDIKIASQDAVFPQQLFKTFPVLIMIIAAGILSFSIIVIDLNIYNKSTLQSGLFFTGIGLWLFSLLLFEKNLKSWMIAESKALQILNMIIVHLIPLSFVLSKLIAPGAKKKKRFYRIALFGFGANFAVLCLFRVLHLPAGFEMACIFYALAAYLAFLEIYYDFKEWKAHKSFLGFTLFLATPLFAGSILHNTVCKLINPYADNDCILIGGILIYVIARIVGMMQRFALQTKEMCVLQEDIIQSKIAVLLSQIRPHFIFNTLNVIGYLCKTDAQKAEEATIKFARYLRTNLDSLDTQTAVPFSVELEHIQNYIEIEQLRLEDLQVLYDIETKDFLIPSLSLQPVVENAIKHGVAHNAKEKIVRITTRKNDFNIFIIVEDNGAGFDVNAVDKQSSIGLHNVEKRIEMMCDAKIEIQSEIGQGTRVTIRIPTNDNCKIKELD